MSDERAGTAPAARRLKLAMIAVLKREETSMRHPAGHGEHAGHRGHHESRAHSHSRSMYLRLAAMAVLSFVVMYWLMFAMVDSPQNVWNNINQAYMAGLMAAPMVLLELALMWNMYANRRLNTVLVAASIGVAIACWLAIRNQGGVTDGQFVRSMIPHHAGAILMCQRNELEDQRLRALCEEIVRSQRAEIEVMDAFAASYVQP